MVLKYYFVLLRDKKKKRIKGINVREDKLEEIKDKVIKKLEIPEVLYDAINESPFLGNYKSVS